MMNEKKSILFMDIASVLNALKKKPLPPPPDFNDDSPYHIHEGGHLYENVTKAQVEAWIEEKRINRESICLSASGRKGKISDFNEFDKILSANSASQISPIEKLSNELIMQKDENKKLLLEIESLKKQIKKLESSIKTISAEKNKIEQDLKEIFPPPSKDTKPRSSKPKKIKKATSSSEDIKKLIEAMSDITEPNTRNKAQARRKKISPPSAYNPKLKSCVR